VNLKDSLNNKINREMNLCNRKTIYGNMEKNKQDSYESLRFMNLEKSQMGCKIETRLKNKKNTKIKITIVGVMCSLF
jgi:hypothetical protein